MRSVLKCYNKYLLVVQIIPCGDVGDDEKEPSAWGYNWATLFLGE
jgi:hypothetical protein